MTIGQLRRDISRRDKHRAQLQDQLLRDAVVPSGTEAPSFDPVARDREVLAQLDHILIAKQQLMASNVNTLITVSEETLSVYQARLKAEALRQLAAVWDAVAKEGMASARQPWMGVRDVPPVSRQVSITVAREHATRLTDWADRLSDAIEQANWQTESNS